LSTDDPSEFQPLGIDPTVSRNIFLGMLALLAGGLLAYNLLKRPMGPPPKEIANDPLLVQGRTIFQTRCVSCHGETGRGDGPISGNLLGPKVGNLTAEQWKHGDQPEQVQEVIAKGVEGTAMSPWGNVLDPPEIKAVAAYLYFLGKRPIPEALRTP